MTTASSSTRAGNKVQLPRGSSDAALMPYHVDRSKLSCHGTHRRHRAARQARASPAPWKARDFPRPCRARKKNATKRRRSLRAADLIGQLGDPHYIRKANALCHEFQEAGINRQLGYDFAGRHRQPLSAILLEQRGAACADRDPLSQRDGERPAVDRQSLQQRVPRRARHRAVADRRNSDLPLRSAPTSEGSANSPSIVTVA